MNIRPAIPFWNATMVYSPEGRNEGPSGNFDTFEAATMFDKLSGTTPEIEDADGPSSDEGAAAGADKHEVTEEDAALDELESELRGSED